MGLKDFFWKNFHFGSKSKWNSARASTSNAPAPVSLSRSFSKAASKVTTIGSCRTTDAINTPFTLTRSGSISSYFDNFSTSSSSVPVPARHSSVSAQDRVTIFFGAPPPSFKLFYSGASGAHKKFKPGSPGDVGTAFAMFDEKLNLVCLKLEHFNIVQEVNSLEFQNILNVVGFAANQGFDRAVFRSDSKQSLQKIKTVLDDPMAIYNYGSSDQNILNEICNYLTPQWFAEFIFEYVPSTANRLADSAASYARREQFTQFWFWENGWSMSGSKELGNVMAGRINQWASNNPVGACFDGPPYVPFDFGRQFRE